MRASRTALFAAISCVPRHSAFTLSSQNLLRRTLVSGRSSTMALRKKSKKPATPSDPIRVARGGSSTSRASMIGGFDNGPMFRGQAIIIGSNLLGFLISLTTSSHYHVDLLGTGAFAAAALPTWLSSTTQRVQWSSGAVVMWSVKLASFLLFRVIQTGGHDNRLTEILTNPAWSAGFWTYSALWGILCSLPLSLGTTAASPGSPLALKVGAALFGAGFLTETLADYQKWMFKLSNPGEFCNVGVWSISQHPNWFGNLLLWAGIFVMNAPALIEPVKPNASILQRLWGCKRLALALVGPLFMWNLFDSQATGRLLGDSLAATRNKYGYGTDPVYTKYIDTTPLIIPNPLQWFQQ